MIFYKNLENFTKLIKIISKKRRIQLFLLLIVSLISGILEIINISLIVPYLNFVGTGKISNKLLTKFLNIEFFNKEKFLIIITFILFGSVLLSMLVRILTLYSQYKLSNSIASDLGLKIFIKSLKMPYFWHLKNNTSILKGYLTKDVDNVSEYINGVAKCLVNLIIAFSIGSYLILL